jgi:hypothetical protein
MKKRTFSIASLIILLTTLFIGNKSKVISEYLTHNKMPYDIIRPDTMALVLADLHLLNCVEKNYAYNGINANELYNYYNTVLNKYEITENDLVKSYAYYSSHLKDFKEVYQKVIEQLKNIDLGEGNWYDRERQ